MLYRYKLIRVMILRTFLAPQFKTKLAHVMENNNRNQNCIEGVKKHLFSVHIVYMR